ncbi:MAG: Eco57I restriction-modification methylase domain-containing protein [Promethearchaeota archaeon]
MREELLWERLVGLADKFIQIHIASGSYSDHDKNILDDIFHRTSIHGRISLIEEKIEPDLIRKEDLRKIWELTDINLQYETLVEIFSEFFSKRTTPQKSQIGQEFTPIPIIEELHTNCRDLISKDTNIRWLDAGCGSGFFIGKVLITELNNHHSKLASINNIEKKQIYVIELFQDLRSRLCALDIDPLGIFATSIFLSILSLLFLRHHNIPLTKKIGSLVPPINIKEEDYLSLTEDTIDFRPDIIFGNPPYIFYRDFSKSALQELKSRGFKTTKGQFDLSDVFIEQSLKLLPQGGVIGFIIPEILLVLDSRHSIREEIIKYSELLKIQPVSDIFHNVSVENILLFARKNTKQTKATNKTIQVEFQDKIKFSGKKSKIGKNMFSMLFSQNEYSDSGDDIISWITKHFLSIDKWNSIYSDITDNVNGSNDSEIPDNQIHVFRGVELSKRGEIMQCPECKVWMPFSSKLPSCKSCSFQFREKLAAHIIIHPLGTQGIDVQNNPNQGVFIQNFSHSQYFLTPDAVIHLDHPGINYKELKLYDSQRIGVRQLLHHQKICAASIPPKALTSQSIYNIRLPPILQPHIKLLINFLRSEMCAYYLFVHFSHGKRLFQRILLNKLKDIPFIPKIIAESLNSGISIEKNASKLSNLSNLPNLTKLPRKFKKTIQSQMN